MARRVGYHVSATGGLRKAVERAESIGCDALQIFPSNPRGWAVPKIDSDLDSAGRAYMEEKAFGPLFLHAPYLVNLAAADPKIRDKSVASMGFALERAASTGAAGVVVHAGSAGSRDRADALVQTARLTLELLEAHPDTHLIYELTAGGGNPIASVPEHLADLFEATENHPRIGICLDTQHLFAAGFDWPSKGGVNRLAREVEKNVGLDRLKCFHVNDSKTALDSKHDRHAVLGTGEIGKEPFAQLFNHKAFRGVPLILETPGELEDHEEEVALLRSLSGG